MIVALIRILMIPGLNVNLQVATVLLQFKKERSKLLFLFRLDRHIFS